MQIIIAHMPNAMNLPNPHPLKILGAALYDGLILLAVLFVAAIPYTLVMGPGFEQDPFNRVAFQLYLLAISYAYFAWFWRQGYPTVGEKVWKLCLRTETGAIPSWFHINKRFLAALLSLALLGVGWLWVFFRGQTLHDQLAGTKITACA